MVKVCATITDILAQCQCLINEQTLASNRLLGPLSPAERRLMAIATKNGKCRIFREAVVRFREPAEVEATAARALDHTQMLAGATEAGA